MAESNSVQSTWVDQRAVALALLLGLTACAGPAEFIRRPAVPVGWPPGPESRVELVLGYRGSEDVVRHPGFWSGLVELIGGASKMALVSPAGLALASDEWLWVADPGAQAVHRISLITGEHELCRGPADAPLQTPVGVAVGPDGRIYVTDSSTARIVILAAGGAALGTFGGAATIGRPTGITFDPYAGRLLVTDTTGCRVHAFDREGKHLGAWGTRGEGPGQFNFPTNIAVASDGRIVVTDSMNFRVQILSPALQPLGTFGIAGRGPGTFASPKGVALDSEGHAYVVDAMFDNVQIFDGDGTLLLVFGSHGSGLGEMSLPSGIFIDDKDRIFVAESGNSRIQMFQYHAR